MKDKDRLLANAVKLIFKAKHYPVISIVCSDENPILIDGFFLSRIFFEGNDPGCYLERWRVISPNDDSCYIEIVFTSGFSITCNTLSEVDKMLLRIV